MSHAWARLWSRLGVRQGPKSRVRDGRRRHFRNDIESWEPTLTDRGPDPYARFAVLGHGSPHARYRSQGRSYVAGP